MNGAGSNNLLLAGSGIDKTVMESVLESNISSLMTNLSFNGWLVLGLNVLIILQGIVNVKGKKD